jgi:predicted lipid-binding transport protein (Tim44 family)
MCGGNVTLSIIILAIAAAFLGLRLYSVLGKRTGHEQEPLIRRPMEETTAPLPRPSTPNAEPIPNGVLTSGHDIDVSAQNGLRAITNADRQFDLGLFFEGAKSAYQLILEAFWRGDKEALQFLCDDDVYDSFCEVIDGRIARGETLENRLIRIENAQIIDAKFDHPVARITIQFNADIAVLVKNADGQMVGGSMSDAIESNDIWTFMRDVKGNDRNWKLDETDEA